MAADSKVITEIADRLSAMIKSALLDAYEAGLRDRDSKIMDDVQKTLAAVMTSLTSAIDTEKQVQHALIAEHSRPWDIRKLANMNNGHARAGRGTAEPAIIDALRAFPDGATTMELLDYLGGPEGKVKYNTIRGTLYRLQTEANPRVRRMGGKWHLSPALVAPPSSER